MIRRCKNIFTVILNEPSRLTIQLKDIQGTWSGKEIIFGDFDKTFSIRIEKDDIEIRKAFKKLSELLNC